MFQLQQGPHISRWSSVIKEVLALCSLLFVSLITYVQEVTVMLMLNFSWILK